eukprot:SAG31_NODE_13503_length_864_cov_13.033987_1_plen_71_part_00
MTNGVRHMSICGRPDFYNKKGANQLYKFKRHRTFIDGAITTRHNTIVSTWDSSALRARPRELVGRAITLR